MNLTVSLEMAKKLKKAGWSMECVHTWEIVGKSTFITHRPNIDNEQYQAPTITELLEEMDNNTILQYENDVMVGLPVGDFIDLFRSPDKLADVYIWGKRKGLIK